MLLALDIGNTNIIFGLFNKTRLEKTWRISTGIHTMPDEYAALMLYLLEHEGITIPEITDAVLCTVVPPLITTFEEVCKHYFKTSPLVIGAGVKTGVRICMDNPREVGADRIVNAVAAHKLYKGPIIVIDLGTATTFDAVSADGDYLGGAIAPGIVIATEALFTRTAALPRVDLTYQIGRASCRERV
jgi:type III pantothenate kinase